VACLIGALVADTLVHAPLAHWAIARADVVAMDDGQTRLTFAQLHDAVQQHANALTQSCAAATVFVDDQLSILDQWWRSWASSARGDVLQ